VGTLDGGHTAPASWRGGSSGPALGSPAEARPWRRHIDRWHPVVLALVARGRLSGPLCLSRPSSPASRRPQPSHHASSLREGAAVRSTPQPISARLRTIRIKAGSASGISAPTAIPVVDHGGNSLVSAVKVPSRRPTAHTVSRANAYHPRCSCGPWVPWPKGSASARWPA